MNRIPAFQLLFIFTLAILFIGCGGAGFLNKEELSGLNYVPNETNSLIYHNTEYNFSSNGQLIIKTHSIIKAGKNAKSLPDLFTVYDGSVEKLVSYNARIIKQDGSTENYSKSDLHKFNLSNNNLISESFIRFLQINQEISEGDLVETIYEHEMILQRLGINYIVPAMYNISSNVSCTIIIPSNMDIDFTLTNSNVEPVCIVNEKENIKSFVFSWNKIINHISSSPFGKKQNLPGLLASYPVPAGQDNKFTWKDFGNWYLDIISPKLIPDDVLKQKALDITSGIDGDLEKMIAIFNYCQKNVRYEQVYLEKGEFIPNQCGLILSRKYGDCKDYAALIFTLAKSIGLNPNLALCFRGRGEEEFHNIPVSQFNHLLVYYTADGKDYWFDGTNRSGIPGLTTSDLINQTAIVIEKDNTRPVKINEFPDNKMSVKGDFIGNNFNDLSGILHIKLDYQYAIDFLYLDFVLESTKMKNFVSKWLMDNISELIEIKDLSWSKGANNFDINVNCRIPNSVTNIEKISYVSIGSVFNKLILPKEHSLKTDDLFYYPGYTSVDVDLKLNNFSAPSSLSVEPYSFMYHYKFDPGPFSVLGKKEFVETFRKITEELNKKIKLIKREAL